MSNKRRGRRKTVHTRSQVDELIDTAIAGQDDELAKRARLVRDGKVDASNMGWEEIWSFAQPDELFNRFDFARSCPGHVDFDLEYHDWMVQEKNKLTVRSNALIDAMLLPLGKNLLDVLIDRGRTRQTGD